MAWGWAWRFANLSLRGTVDAFGPYLLPLMAPFFNSLCRSREMTARDHPPLLRKKGPTPGGRRQPPRGVSGFVCCLCTKQRLLPTTNELLDRKRTSSIGASSKASRSSRARKFTPVLRISVLQPNKRGADVRMTVLGVVNNNWLFAPSWHEDLDSVIVIAVGALIERTLNAVVSLGRWTA